MCPARHLPVGFTSGNLVSKQLICCYLDLAGAVGMPARAHDFSLVGDAFAMGAAVF
jgi:hypothetical protein